MEIISAKHHQLEEIMEFISNVVYQMQSEGLDHWGDDYPNRTVFLNDIKNQNLYLMVENDEIIAVIAITDDLEPQYSEIDWEDSKGKVLEVHRLAVHPRWQRKGVARALMDYAERFAMENNFTSIRLDTYSENLIALNFYEKRG